MKKLSIVGFAAILAATVSFAGCESVENSSQIPQANETKIKAAKNELAIPAETVSDIDLPTVLNGVAISWASSDEDVISSAGLVTRQPYDTAATLTATLTLGGASDTKEFDVTVLAVVEEKAQLFQTRGGGMSSANSVIMTMVFLDQNVVYTYTVDKGVLDKVKIGEMPESPIIFTKNLNANSDDLIFWTSIEYLDDGSGVTEAFVEIILKLEQNIIGYAVIWCVRDDGAIIKSVLFPQVDGKYQNISEEYVKAAFEEVRANYWDYFEESRRR